jgi:hypothetical protein
MIKNKTKNKKTKWTTTSHINSLKTKIKIMTTTHVDWNGGAGFEQTQRDGR